MGGDPVIGSGTLADGVMDYLYEADAIDVPEGTDYYSEPDFSNRSVWIPSEDEIQPRRSDRERKV